MSMPDIHTTAEFVEITFDNVANTWITIENYDHSGLEISTGSDEQLGYSSFAPTLEQLKALHEGIGRLIAKAEAAK